MPCIDYLGDSLEKQGYLCFTRLLQCVSDGIGDLLDSAERLKYVISQSHALNVDAIG